MKRYTLNLGMGFENGRISLYEGWNELVYDLSIQPSSVGSVLYVVREGVRIGGARIEREGVSG
jgi:hypothetical protein